MQVVHIFPTANAQLMARQSMNMLLTHLVQNSPEYRKQARDLRGYKILDNSLIELGQALSIDQVVTSAYEVGAHEIVLPDVFQNGPETIKAVDEALERLREIREGSLGLERAAFARTLRVMAVVQGENEQQFCDCFRTLNTYPEIHVLGIPKVCAKMHPEGRPHFEYLWLAGSKEIHLLGLWYGWEELFRYTCPASIRSVDTVMATYLALNDLPWNASRTDGYTVDLMNDQLSTFTLNQLVLLDRVGF